MWKVEIEWRSSKAKFVVLLVRADPEPVVVAVSFACDRTIASANLNCVNAAFLLKAERRMPRVRLEQSEILLRESLHVLRQLIITSPERREGVGLHGIGRKFPASISASILSKAAACLPPGEKSSSICSSQPSLS
jgi:hypothetical protein